MDATDLHSIGTCSRCGLDFCEAENFGGWSCRQHFGEIVDGRLTCCNMETPYVSLREFYKRNFSDKTRGCIACDHSTSSCTWDTIEGTVHFKAGLIRGLSGFKARAVFDVLVNTGIICMRRYDWVKQDAAREIMQKHLSARPQAYDLEVNGFHMNTLIDDAKVHQALQARK